MTDNEIIKIADAEPFCELAVAVDSNGDFIRVKDLIDIINRKKAEIEELNKNCKDLISTNIFLVNRVDKAKSEAIKEFAERLTNRICENVNRSLDNPKGYDYYPIDVYKDIDKLVKEMTEQKE